MKKYLVIRRYKMMDACVEASFDVKDDAFQYARLCEVRDDNKYEYIVAEVLQCKRERKIFSPLFSCLFFACGNIKNTSKLLAEEEEKDVDVWMLGYQEQSPHAYIYTFCIFHSCPSFLIYSFSVIIFINDYLNLLNIVSPLIIYNYVKVSFI